MSVFKMVARWLHETFVNPYKYAILVTSAGFEPATFRAEI